MSSILDMIGALTGGSSGQSQPQAEAMDNQDDVVVNGFKQTKRNIFGKIADGILAAYGQKPLYESRMRERDVRGAMEGFSSDPMTAIKRISQIPGMQDEAFKLYNQQQDNVRADGQLERQNKLFDMKYQEAIIDRIANMMGAATPQTWEAMRARAGEYAKAKGVDLPIDLPEKYDPDIVNMIRYGEVPVAKQMQQAETERYHSERLQDFDNSEAGKNARAAASRAGVESRFERSQSAAQQRFETKEQRLNKSKGGGVPVQTPQGPGELSPDGSKLKVGDKFFKKSADGKKWERYK